MNSDRGTGEGLLLCANLFFISKVTGTARALGFSLDAVMSAAAAADRLRAGQPRLLLIDLAAPGLDLPALLAALPGEDRPHVVAFGPHVETERFAMARSAGCDEVWPHSRLSAELPQLLHQYLAEGPVS